MSFDIALTGLDAAGTQLNAISNNIANNATSGFKSSRAEFADVFALSTFGASSPATGQGVQVSGVRQDFGQGDNQFTNRNLDLSVEGLGMFKLDDNGTSVYTRSGNFGMDNEGFIINPNGNFLTGFGVDDNGSIEPITGNLQIDYSDLPPSASTELSTSANLESTTEIITEPFDATDTSTFSYATSTTVYDSLGTSLVANIYYRRDGANTWTAFPYVDGAPVTTAGAQVNFDTDGSLIDVNAEPNGTFLTDSFTPTEGADEMQIEIDLSELTQYDSSFGVNSVSQDGFSAGRLEDFDIDSEGVMFGRFTNGQTKTMGQITLTNFANQEGLRQVGATSWTETITSGEPATGAPGSATLGTLSAGTLEGSNVDITKELVSMIGAQRSFQANAQVITTNNTLTQTVLNMTR